MAIPSSTIYICSGVRLNNSYDHTIYFQNESAQRSYFASKIVKQFENYVYLRKSWDLRVNATMAEAFNWNYLYFRNPGYSPSRYFYYFINDIEFENDNTVILKLELDVMQTYHFDYKLQPCFVEREHVNDDSLGVNTVSESLDVGDLMVNASVSSSYTDWCIMIQTTVDLGTTGYPPMLSSRFNGIFSGLVVYAVEMKNWQAVGETFRFLADAGKSEAINAMWMYPKDLLTLESGESWDSATVFKKLTGCQMHAWSTSMPAKLNGYTPKNNKVRQYPFSFMYVTDNNGSAAVYKYEYFGDSSDMVFNTFGLISPEGVAALYPLNYKGVTHNYDEKIVMSGFPSCAWNSDVYRLWLAQTQNQRSTTNMINGLTIAGGAVMAVGGAMTGNVGLVAAGAGSMIHAGSAIAQNVAQKEDKSIMPPQASGTQSGGLNMVAGEQEFTIYHKSVDAYHAKMIDDYFSMFGYACKQVKIPNVTGRETWNYVKTIGSNIKPAYLKAVDDRTVGMSFCTADINKINSIFDKGITFWHVPDSIGDYSLSNLIK